MHKELVKRFKCPACNADASRLEVTTFREQGDVVLDGVLICPACKGWYPIEDALLELVVPDLLDKEGLAGFFHAYEAKLIAAGCRLPDMAKIAAGHEAQIEQRKHFDWYADNEQQDYNAYQNTPFWRAADTIAFSRWKTMVRKDAWILDVGSADGRSSFQWTDLVDHVVGFDISKKMIRKPILRARKAGLEQRTSFFVGDAYRIPVRDAAFEYACTYGVLHHVPKPDATYREIIRMIKPDGIFFASENNKSAFRAVFDWLMRISPLWTELAGEEPLISLAMVNDWAKGQPVRVSTRTAVFLPPHVFNIVGNSVAKPLMRLTDCLNQGLPWFRHQGGLIVFESQKTTGASAS